MPPYDPNAPYIIYGDPIDSDNQISESFEDPTFPPAGWTKINVAGGTGWARLTVGTTPIPGWNGGTVTPTPSGNGGNAMVYMTWNLGGPSSNDNWLITPQLMNVGPGDTLSFWMRKFSDQYSDNVDIRISTTVNNDPAAFNIVVQNIVFAAADTGWNYYSYEIGNMVPPGSDIYIGFREHVADNFNDGAAIFIDEVNAGGDYIPVELVSFSADVVDNSVKLLWTTATELNNRGFEIQRAADDNFFTIGFVEGYGTTTETKTYSYTDKNINSGSYNYRLKQIDFDGTFEYSDAVEVDVNIVTGYKLGQNYPNPFNPFTVIEISLPNDANVSLKVYNVLGQEVKTLFTGNLDAGLHTIHFDASNLNSGVYFYKIEASGTDGREFSSVRKMLLSK
jgi:hypothetical protein